MKNRVINLSKLKFGTRTRVLKLAIKKEIKPVALCCDSTENILRLPTAFPVSCNL